MAPKRFSVSPAPKARSSVSSSPRASQAARGRSSSAEVAGKLFDAELKEVFRNLCFLGCDSEPAGDSNQLSDEAFAEAQRQLVEITAGRCAAGSGLAGVRQQRGSDPSRLEENSYLHLLSKVRFVGQDSSSTDSLEYPQFYAWQAQLLKEAGSSVAVRKQMLVGALPMLEQLSSKRVHRIALAEAHNVSDLSTAVQNATQVLSAADPELALHRQRLESLKEPFMVKLSSLAGEAHEVEVTRTLLVGMLRAQAAEAFERKPYRILLAHTGASLNTDAASLESCGVSETVTEIGVSFCEEDKFQEMPFSEFLDLVLTHKICVPGEMDQIKAELAAGNWKEVDVVYRYRSLVETAVEFSGFMEEWKQQDEEHEKLEADLKADMPTSKAQPSQERIVEAQAALSKFKESVESSVVGKETLCGKFYDRSAAVRNEAERKLSVVIPELQQVNDALQNITKEQMCELMGFTVPPNAVLHVMKAICIFLGLGPTSCSRPLQGYWDAFLKAFRGNPSGLLDSLMYYDKDNIPSSVLRDTKAFAQNTALAPENIRNVSRISEAFCIWVRGMHSYASVACQVIPLKQEVMLTENCLRQAQQALHGSQQRLLRIAEMAVNLKQLLEMQADNSPD